MGCRLVARTITDYLAAFGDINGHGLIGVGDGQGAEVCRGDSEVLREQLRGVGEAGDAAVLVMQGQ